MERSLKKMSLIASSDVFRQLCIILYCVSALLICAIAYSSGAGLYDHNLHAIRSTIMQEGSLVVAMIGSYALISIAVMFNMFRISMLSPVNEIKKTSFFLILLYSALTLNVLIAMLSQAMQVPELRDYSGIETGVMNQMAGMTFLLASASLSLYTIARKKTALLIALFAVLSIAADLSSISLVNLIRMSFMLPIIGVMSFTNYPVADKRSNE